MVKICCFKNITILILLFVFSVFGYAQTPSIKFGKVTEDELLIKTCAMDTSAGAMVLGDYGLSYFLYDQSRERFYINFERHVRIKILKKSGYEAANDVIKYYRSGSLREEVIAIKGYTYNLEDGKINKTKLEKDGIFEEELNDNWTLKKISMPNIREGSVIEYTYTLKSYFYFNLQEWEFQREIPVLWSEYEVKFPDYFEYKVVSQGYEPFKIYEKKKLSESMRIGSGGISTPVQINHYRWAVSNVPGISEEPYMTTIDDYITKIEFELASILYPGNILKNFSRNWESITTELLSHEKFGKQLEKSAFIKPEVVTLSVSSNTQEEKLLNIYNYLKSNMKWNGSDRLFVSQNLKKSFEDKTGNSADINLLLILMLKEAGLDAEPLIISTRKHGRANMHWPTINKFNYVLCHVLIDGKSLVLDATDPFYPYNTLPQKCLNGEGKVISKKRDNTVNIGGAEREVQFYMVNYDVDVNGNMKGKIQYSRGSVLASDGRKSIYSKGQEIYKKELVAKYDDWNIEDYKILNLEAIHESLKEEFNFSSKDFSGNNQSILYFNPLIFAAKKDNPFKLDIRKFPVDFACPVEETVIVKINIPEGYIIDEKPESIVLVLPDNTSKFVFSVVEEGNTLQINSKISITSRYFIEDSYLYLRELFNQIVAKHSQQVVLKKI